MHLIATMCCEFPAKVYVCGGKGCSLVKDFFSSIGTFCGFLFRPFAGTSAKDVLTFSSGNPIAGLQAIMILTFWFSVVYGLFQMIFTFAGMLVAPVSAVPDLNPAQSQQFDQQVKQTMTRSAIMMSIIFLLCLCIGSYCAWFGSVKRRGCAFGLFFCIEGYFILYLLSCQSFLYVLYALATMIAFIKLSSPAGFILVVMMVPMCVMQVYSGVYLFKAASLTDEEHDKDLESMSDDDSES